MLVRESPGRVVVLTYADGIAFVAENPSKALRKISEILTDRIAFAAVGKYNEFENLRMAGVRLADLRGYSYDRRDVTGRGLANAYAQTLGSIFIEHNKPYEVEIVVAELGDTTEEDQIYRLTYDGSVGDESGFVAMGGQAEARPSSSLRAAHREGLQLGEAIRVALRSLEAGHQQGGQVRSCCGPTSSRWRFWTGTGRAAPSGASPVPRWKGCSESFPQRARRGGRRGGRQGHRCQRHCCQRHTVGPASAGDAADDDSPDDEGAGADPQPGEGEG